MTRVGYIPSMPAASTLGTMSSAAASLESSARNSEPRNASARNSEPRNTDPPEVTPPQSVQPPEACDAGSPARRNSIGRRPSLTTINRMRRRSSSCQPTVHTLASLRETATCYQNRRPSYCDIIARSDAPTVEDSFQLYDSIPTDRRWSVRSVNSGVDGEDSPVEGTSPLSRQRLPRPRRASSESSSVHGRRISCSSAVSCQSAAFAMGRKLTVWPPSHANSPGTPSAFLPARLSCPHALPPRASPFRCASWAEASVLALGVHLPTRVGKSPAPWYLLIIFGSVHRNRILAAAQLRSGSRRSRRTTRHRTVLQLGRRAKLRGARWARFMPLAKP